MSAVLGGTDRPIIKLANTEPPPKIANVIATKAKPRPRKARHRDRIEKRDLYEQHGVREFWLIDPEAKTVEVFFLEKEQYRLLGRFRSGQTAESCLLAGFKVAVDTIFESAS